MKSKTGASLNRGGSKQDYQTPGNFMAAVQKRFGKVIFDLAAHAGNHQHANYFTLADDSLEQNWSNIDDEGGGLLWLNPPFDNIRPWAAKCALESKRVGAPRIALLVPASIGSNWFAESVYPFASVYALRPRLMFVGASDPYPKDCILCIYAGESKPCFECWKWR